jgi:hypothetical protein
MMRAMRAVLCRTLRQKIVLLADPDLLTSTMASKAASNAVQAAAWVLDDPDGPNPMLRPSNPLIYTSMSRRPYLS